MVWRSTFAVGSDCCERSAVGNRNKETLRAVTHLAVLGTMPVWSDRIANIYDPLVVLNREYHTTKYIERTPHLPCNPLFKITLAICFEVERLSKRGGEVVSRYGTLQRCSIVPDFAHYARNNIPNDRHPLGAGYRARAA